MHMDPNRRPDAILDETCLERLRQTNRCNLLHACAKMTAEITATTEAARCGLLLAVVMPCITRGPRCCRSRSGTWAWSSRSAEENSIGGSGVQLCM
ncbi:unnamed protein product [Urochloa humidicola]